MAPQMLVEVEATKVGELAIVTMKGTENRINIKFCKRWLKALEKVESWPDVKAMVTTGSGRFYSNGLDLAYLTTAPPEELEEFGDVFYECMKRLLLFPMVTIAAINGHCFAGGAVIAFLHDYRVMQSGKGWLCFNEVDLGMRFSEAMKRIFMAKFNAEMIRDAVIYGTRYTAEEALKSKLIHKVCSEGSVVPTAVEMAKGLVENRTYTRQMVTAMKEDFYGQIFGDKQGMLMTAGYLKGKL